jgi:hypothetical protein
MAKKTINLLTGKIEYVCKYHGVVEDLKRRQRRGFYYYNCTVCLRASSRKSYQAHKDDVRSNCKKYYQAHKEKYLQRAKKYRSANREKTREYMKAYYSNNKEKFKKKIPQDNSPNLMVGDT